MYKFYVTYVDYSGEEHIVSLLQDSDDFDALESLFVETHDVSEIIWIELAF